MSEYLKLVQKDPCFNKRVASSVNFTRNKVKLWLNCQYVPAVLNRNPWQQLKSASLHQTQQENKDCARSFQLYFLQAFLATLKSLWCCCPDRHYVLPNSNFSSSLLSDENAVKTETQATLFSWMLVMDFSLEVVGKQRISKPLLKSLGTFWSRDVKHKLQSGPKPSITL